MNQLRPRGSCESRATTGVDDVLSGGLPAGPFTLIEGDPGTRFLPWLVEHLWPLLLRRSGPQLLALDMGRGPWRNAIVAGS